jgi:hypothetical protein
MTSLVFFDILQVGLEFLSAKDFISKVRTMSRRNGDDVVYVYDDDDEETNELLKKSASESVATIRPFARLTPRPTRMIDTFGLDTANRWERHFCCPTLLWIVLICRLTSFMLLTN